MIHGLKSHMCPMHIVITIFQHFIIFIWIKTIELKQLFSIITPFTNPNR